MSMNQSRKLVWRGKVVAVQPRIRLLRSFDERYHSYLGYTLLINGCMDQEPGEFVIAIGKAAQARKAIRVVDLISGQSVPVLDERREYAGFYKTTQLKIIERNPAPLPPSPPWHDLPPALEVFRERGHRRLASRTFTANCRTCMWACKMPVEMIIDHWNPGVKRYRNETFCYGPKSCKFYKAGPTRKVPGRKGMSWEEEDWIDDEYTAHRGEDD